MKTGILGFGIQNTGLGIRNPTNDYNPESNKRLESEIQVQLTKAETQHLESAIRGVRTFMDCLTWGELLKRALA